MRKISRIARIGKVGLLRGLDPIKPPPPVVEGGAPRQLDALPEGMRDIARRVGDKRAKRVWKLMQRGIVGTVPELCIYDGLEQRKVSFEFQSSQMGGRHWLGGAVVDFILYNISPNGIYVIRVQGEYWHEGEATERKDEAQRVRLLRHKIGGVPIVKVIDCFENDIYDRWPEVLDLAIMGEEIHRWR